ncbi:MAG TPA: hypothetical protein HA319_00920 [Nitrosopumilaceae archaeon]|jgi:hypothetical protein|nr:hypothetical protein [Nitrosopumilaceae archaeon]
MKLSNALSIILISNRKSIINTIAILAVSGTVVELLAGIWDATSHLMLEPDLFWTIQHVAVYTGVGMITCSAILGSIILIFNPQNISNKKGLKFLIIGTLLQITAGYADSIFHEVYGVDGLVTISHLILETGLLLSALGGFLLLSSTKSSPKIILQLAILSVLLSSTWIGFNFMLLFASVSLCLPIYEVFSSGCAVL